jgi:hypothetical protein
MMGEKNYLKEVKPYSNSYVTFGNGAKGRIKGISKLVSPGLPCLGDELPSWGDLPSFQLVNFYFKSWGDLQNRTLDFCYFLVLFYMQFLQILNLS